jgi:hypothetical protein
MYILILFAGVFVLVLFANASERKRRDEVEKIAASMQLRYSRDGVSTLVGELTCFQLFTGGQDRKTSNVLYGTVADVDVHVFDYRYSSGGSSPTTYTHAVAYIRSTLVLPGFRLQPSTILHKIGNLFGYQDIDFASHPRFSKTYLLRGKDEDAIRRVFTPAVLNFCETQQKLNVEGSGDKMIIYRYGTLQAKDVQDLVRTAVQLNELMRTR